MHRSRQQRLVRGGVAATIATFVALLSHIAAGGAVPGWLGIGAPFALSLMVCTALAGRRLSLARLSVAVVASQVLFHTLFVFGTPVSDATALAAHHHGLAAGALNGAHGIALHADAIMWLGHVFAAVVTVAALHRGESAVVTLAEIGRRLARELVQRLLVPVFAIATPRRATLWVRPSVAPVVRAPIATTHTLRGPPRAC